MRVDSTVRYRVMSILHIGYSNFNFIFSFGIALEEARVLFISIFKILDQFLSQFRKYRFQCRRRHSFLFLCSSFSCSFHIRSTVIQVRIQYTYEYNISLNKEEEGRKIYCIIKLTTGVMYVWYVTDSTKKKSRAYVGLQLQQITFV